VMHTIHVALLENRPKYSSIKGIGVSDDQNPRWRETMEDQHVMEDKYGGDLNQGYFGVYDGHGGRGVVEFIPKALHKNLLEEIAALPNDISQDYTKTYLRTDKEIIDRPIQRSGSTAVSALIRKNASGQKWLHVANIGDARAILCRNGTAQRLTYEHKSTDEAEVKRIKESGGFIVKKRVGGTLAVSRAFGDVEVKTAGLIANPHTEDVELTPTDTHLILACDGLWDVATDQKAVDLIQHEVDPQKMSDKLLYYALNNGTKDNVTVMVIAL